MTQRLLGTFLLAVGGLIAYLCVYWPLEAARQHGEIIFLSLKCVLLCPMSIIFGVFFLVYGESATQLLGTRQRPKSAAYLLGFIAVCAGMLLYFWLDTHLGAAGYEFH